MKSFLPVLFAVLFCGSTTGQSIERLTDLIPRDTARPTEVIRQSGSYSGSGTFRIIGDQATNVEIHGDGDAKLDLSTVQLEGEVVNLDNDSAGSRILRISGVSTVSGSSGPDVIRGSNSPNRLRGFGGDDTIYSTGGECIVSGGAGNDTLIGASSADLMRGGMGDDTIQGSGGADYLSGGAGSDFIYGNAGNDILSSGAPGVYAPFRRPRQLASQKASTQQDIVFVIFDDLAKSLYANNTIVMPNLSRFAATSVNFTNAHANSPLCNPSRASLLTGLYPESAEVVGSLQNQVVPTSRYIQKHLQSHGFEVGEFGKVRNHTVSQDDIGLDDHFFRYTQVRGAKSSYGVINVANRAEASTIFSDAAAVDAAKIFLNRNQTGPRATFLGITRPHSPWVVPHQDWTVISAISDDEIRRMAAAQGTTFDSQNEAWLNSIPAYAKTSLAVSSSVGTAEIEINRIRHYLASAHFADRLFGEFMESVPDDVTVVVTSDHGMHLSNRRPGLSKATLWPQALRVPLYIRNTGFAASERSETVGLVDLYNTITDLAGVDRASHVEGRSLEPLLRQIPNWEKISVATIGHEYNTRGPSQDHGFLGWSVTHDNWHLIRYEDGSQELYHLLTDPNAVVNIAENEIFSAVIHWLSGYLPRDADFLFGGPGSDIYQVGGGRLLISEGSNNSDADEVHIDADRDELEFSKAEWGDNSETMRIDHPGGSVFIFDQYSKTSHSIETLKVRDGYFDLTTDGNPFCDQASIDTNLKLGDTNLKLGDADQNGTVNFLDISAFILTLQNGNYLVEADINQDGVVNFLDISPFITLLSSQ